MAENVVEGGQVLAAGCHRDQEPRPRHARRIHAQGDVRDASPAHFSFAKNGEWAKPRMDWTQVQNAQPNNLDQFRDGTAQPIVWPLERQDRYADLSVR